MGRLAPSPSGRMHLGNAFSALMAWLGAKSRGGSVVMRLEDLDPRCQVPERAAALMDDLRWLGLSWDGDPVFQSQRQSAYDEALERLKALGVTYPCFCTRAELHAASAPHASDGTYVYAGTCRSLSAAEVAARSRLRPPALRVAVPEATEAAGTIAVDDLVAGRHVEVLAQECGDFIVRRSDRVMAYQLAVVVDDAAMGVTQVVRGRDLLGSTARQRYLQRLLGLPQVEYAHVPLLVAPDGRRLSKRDGDLDLGAIRARGTRPETVVGALAAAAGLIDGFEPVAAGDLVGQFSWDHLRGRGDIVANETLLGHLC
ncbi:tRNA glutamyl-Q(34) synthetase GluQRS [Atopobiaceae bacterium 24-176]